MTAIPRPRRSALYLPASNARAIDKARTIDADAIIFDLEDAVAPEARPAAREHLRAAFAQGGYAGRETVIRANAIGSEDHRADLAVIARCAPDAVLLPKVSGAAAVDRFAADAAAVALPATMTSWFMIETADGLAALESICAAGAGITPRLACLVVGTNDIARETGVSMGERRAYLVPWLMQIVLAAKRHGLAVLDGVWNDFRDTAGFEAEAAQSRAMGFDGKTLIHPTQVEPANRAFSPSAAALAEARAIVGAFARPEHAQAGVISLGGRMVERLHLEQAERLLALEAAIRRG